MRLRADVVHPARLSATLAVDEWQARRKESSLRDAAQRLREVGFLVFLSSILRWLPGASHMRPRREASSFKKGGLGGVPKYGACKAAERLAP
jgi:hypothetical protein